MAWNTTGCCCNHGFRVGTSPLTNDLCQLCNGRSFNVFEFSISGVTDIVHSNASTYNGTFRLIHIGTSACSWQTDERAFSFDGTTELTSERWNLTTAFGIFQLRSVVTNTGGTNQTLIYSVTPTSFCDTSYVLSRQYGLISDAYDAPATVTIRAV